MTIRPDNNTHTTQQRPTRLTPKEWIGLAKRLGLRPGRRVGPDKISIDCPACHRTPDKTNPSEIVLFVHDGGFDCKPNGCTGHLHTIAREHGFLDDAFNAPPTPRHAPEPSRSISRLIDLNGAHQVLTHLKTSVQRRHIAQWAIKRNCPKPIAHQLARLPDVLRITRQMPGTSSGAKAARAIAKRFDNRPLCFFMRDQHGQLASLKCRGSQTHATKSKEVPNELTGARDFRAFGFDPKAIAHAAHHGLPIVLVEGEADWAMTQATLNLQGGGVALGAWNNRAMTHLANHLADAIPEDTKPHIYVFPDEDGKEHSITKTAALAAVTALLRTPAHVHLVTVPEPYRNEQGKADAADVLCKYGVEALMRLILDAPLAPSRAKDILQQRQQLADIGKDIFLNGGMHVINADLGTGKTFIVAIQSALDALKNNPRQRFIIAFNTRDLVKEKAKEALDLTPLHIPITTILGRGPENCELMRSCGPQPIQAAATLKPHGVSHLCASCPFQADCRKLGYLHERQRLANASPYGLVFTTNSCLAMRPELRDGAIAWSFDKQLLGDADVVIFDEFPEPLKADITLNGSQLDAIGLAPSFLANETAELALRGLLAKPGAKADDRRLAELAPPGSFTFDATQIDMRAQEALLAQLAGAPEQAQTLLDHQAPWFAAEVLERACNLRWQGCYVSDGKLFLPAFPMNLPLAQGKHMTAILDATMTPKVAQALLPGATYHHLGGLAPETCRVFYTDFKVSAATLLNTTTNALAMAVRRRFDGPNTLHGTHKRYAKDLNPQLQGQVLHHGGTLARGSNAFKHHDTVVLDDFYVPTHTKRALAQRLALRAGADNACDFNDDATFLLELAPMLQLAGRIRFNDGLPARVIVLSDRHLPGLPCDGILTKDQIMLDAGLVPKGRHGAPVLLNELMETAGGVLVPEFWPTEPVTKGLATQVVLGGKESLLGDKDNSGCKPLGDGLEGLKRASVAVSVKNHFGRDWSWAAKEAGLLCTHIQTSRRGKPVAVLHKQTLTHAALQRALWGHVDWFQGAEGRVYLERSPLEVAAVKLVEQGQQVSVKAVAALEGVSTQAIYKRLKEECWTSTQAFLDHYNQHLDAVQHAVQEKEGADEEPSAVEGSDPPPQEPPPCSPGLGAACEWEEGEEVEVWMQLAMWQHGAQRAGQKYGPSGMELARLGLSLEMCGSLWALTMMRGGHAWSWLELSAVLGRPVGQLRSMSVKASRRVGGGRRGAQEQRRWRVSPPQEPEDMQRWRAVCEAVEGSALSLMRVLGMYLPGVDEQEKRGLVRRLLEASEEKRAWCVEGLWVVGGVKDGSWRRLFLHRLSGVDGDEGAFEVSPSVVVEELVTQ